MKCVEDTGTVVELGDGKATILLDHKPEKGCGKGCCACSILANGRPTVEAPAAGLKRGDRVRVRMPQVNEWLGMLFVFGLPIVLGIMGLVLGSKLDRASGGGTYTVVGGGIGLVLAMAAGWTANGVIIRRGAVEVQPLAEEPGERQP